MNRCKLEVRIQLFKFLIASCLLILSVIFSCVEYDIAFEIHGLCEEGGRERERVSESERGEEGDRDGDRDKERNKMRKSNLKKIEGGCVVDEIISNWLHE